MSGFERLVVELHFIDKMPTNEISEVLEVDQDEVEFALDGIRARVTAVRSAVVKALCRSAAEPSALASVGGAG
ncbi:MAG: sigma-70 family RNA polymerase sigma factor [Planctomycetes bacterium]|nr:sigma-70 family RNA polymerase sigma factor [Planctomycetota bacterium]